MTAVKFETDGPVAVITLNRPDARNAVNAEVAQGLEAAVDHLEADESLRVAILTANVAGQSKPVFCAGADLKTVLAEGADSLRTQRGGFAGYVFRDRTKPIIAAVDGLAVGGGFEIMLASDLAVGTERSSFAFAEARHNLVAEAGGLFRLYQSAGKAVAMEALLTGIPIPATRAYELGLISRLVSNGGALDCAHELASAIVRCGPLAVRESRRVMMLATSADEAKLRSASDEASSTVVSSADFHEGLAAFRERREPVWSGR
jgi:enoyl-CoA hydratase